jgi:hypothetical protein
VGNYDKSLEARTVNISWRSWRGEHHKKREASVTVEGDAPVHSESHVLDSLNVPWQRNLQHPRQRSDRFEHTDKHTDKHTDVHKDTTHTPRDTHKETHKDIPGRPKIPHTQRHTQPRTSTHTKTHINVTHTLSNSFRCELVWVPIPKNFHGVSLNFLSHISKVLPMWTSRVSQKRG